jgi:tetratricopeptide (TPR) repeat protein
MAIEGPLKELGIHDVFQLLDLSRKTGTLSVTSNLRRNQGTVVFQDGAIVYAEIQSNPHPLGSLLVRAGKIADADVQRARDMQQRGDRRRLGELLVSIGAVSQRELERQVRFQIEEVVFELLSWREGYFSFAEGDVREVPSDASVRIPTEAVLMEGARRIDEWSQIEGKIPHLGVVPTLAPASGGGEGSLDLLPTEWEVLAAIDGERDVRGIATMLGRSEFEVAKTIFGLESAAVLTITEPKRSSGESLQATDDVDALLERATTAAKDGELEEARSWAEQARSLEPQEPAPYSLLGRLELAAQRPREAEEYLRRALRLDPLLVSAHRLLGDALALQGRFGEAVEWWQRWLKIGEHDEQTDVGELQRVKDAVRAAETLDALVRAAHG